MNGKKMTREREKSLRSLAMLMNTRHRTPFPVTRPLLECFDVAVTSDEAEYLLRLGPEPFTAAEALSKSGLSEDQFHPLFEGLLRKGLVWPRQTSGGEEVFALPGIMLGWFEVYLSDGNETPAQKEFARRLDRLFRSWGKMNVFPVRNLLNYQLTRRTRPAQSIAAIETPEAAAPGKRITVDQTLPATAPRIYPAQTVRELIGRLGDSESIALVHCFCRQYHKLIGENCRFEHPPESCMAIGSLARHALKFSAARSLSKSEAMELLEQLQARGAVHQVFHENEDADQPEIAICNCCQDCCGVLGSYNRGIIPLHFRSYFEARVVDASLCDGCETCADYCPVGAISLVESKARIDARKCIGCGQCALQCPQGSVGLVAHERNVILPLLKPSQARIKEGLH